MKDKITISAELDAPIAKVWKAIADKDEFGKWFGIDYDKEFEVGKSSSGTDDETGYKMAIMVTKMEKEKLFCYTWHPYSGDAKADYSKEKSTAIEFKFTKSGSKTKLDITESGFNELPAARKDKAFEMHTQGWDYQLKNIINYLAKKST